MTKLQIENQSSISVGLAHFRGFALFLVVIILAGLAAFLIFRNGIGNAIRTKVENELNTRLSSRGVTAKVGSCELIEGQGIRFRDLELTNTDDRKTILTIDECFVQVSAYLPELILGQQQIQGLEVHRAKIQIQQQADGNWNLEELGKLFGDPDEADSTPSIYVRDSRIKLLAHKNTRWATRTVNIDKINLDILQNSNSKLVDILGVLSADYVGDVFLRCQVDPNSKRWSAGIKSTDANVDGQLLDLLPQSLCNSSAQLKTLKGTCNLSGWINGSLESSSIPKFEFTGNFSEIQFQNENLPYPLLNCSGNFVVNNDRLSLRQIKGSAGQGTFELDFTRFGHSANSQWTAKGSIRNLEIESELYPKLPAHAQKIWRQYSPQAVSDVFFDFYFDGSTVYPDIKANIAGGSFEFFKYPYRINQCAGTIHWNRKKCLMNLTAKENGQPITITCDVNNPGPDWTGSLDLQVHGFLPIDKKLINTLKNEPELLETVQSFSPTGELSLTGRWERKTTEKINPEQSLRIQLRNCSVRYKHFDYPFYDVNGLIVTGNGYAKFQQIEGAKDNGYVICNGDWSKNRGLKLNFECQSIALDDQLRHAIGKNQQEIWDRLQPAGTVDLLSVNVVHQKGMLAPKVDIEGQIFEQTRTGASNVSIQPTWFPYVVSGVSGKFKLGDGQVELMKMSGAHGNTWIRLDGLGQYDNAGWQLDLKNILVGSLNVDEDLYYALPNHLEQAVRRLEFDGLVNVRGTMKLSGTYDKALIQETRFSTQPSNRFQLDWDLKFNTIGADLFVGLPIKNLTGHTRLIGRQNGDRAYSYGEISIDSMVYEDVQVTNLVGPLSINANGVRLGTQADLPAGQAAASPLTGDIFGGKVALDANVSSESDGEFEVRTTFHEFDLTQLSADVTGKTDDVAGTGYAGILLKGDTSGVNSLRGDGYVRLRNAKIYELPVILALLKVARVSQFDLNAFDESNVDFKVHGRDIELSRIELIGNAVSLIGNGQMNLDHQIDLDFYSVVGRNRLNIPLLSRLYREGSKQILWIHVDGSLYQPSTRREMLPGLNDTLRQVFEELEAVGVSQQARQDEIRAPLIEFR